MKAALVALALVVPHGTAVITTPHARISVRVEIAATEQTRERGLMFRRRLAPRAGMAFVWREDVSARGRIVRILDMAPCRADPCPVYDPQTTYRGALEVNRGAFRRWDVRVGDRLMLRRSR